MTESIARKREPTMTQGTLEERAQALVAALPTVISKASQREPIVRGRQSAVQAALESRRDELLSLLDKHSAHRLARLIHDEAPIFSEEAIRIALKRMAGAPKPSVRSRQSKANGSARTSTAQRASHGVRQSRTGLATSERGSIAPQFDAITRQNDDL